jgi:hypothetical protein
VATDQLLEWEDIEPPRPNWTAIESNASIAVEARKVFARRKRWAADYDRMIAIVRRQLVGGFTEFANALPEAEPEDRQDTETAPFTVPLASLLHRPAEVVERLIMALYEDDTLRYDLFVRVRERLVTNMLIASGFSPTTNLAEIQDRLLLPTRQTRINRNEITDVYLARTPFADLLNLPTPFHIPEAVRCEHCHIVGGTGHGKTQLMQRMIHADLLAAQKDGRSVVVIDSQGDLINKLVRLDLFSPEEPQSLADRLVLIDPADVEYPPALNLFDAHLDRLSAYGLADRERVLNGVIELYETFFGALLGAELTQKQGVIFRYLARLMLTIPGATIHTLMQLMEEGHVFKAHMAKLDGSARYFFEKEFFHPSFSATKKQILKRLWGVLSTPAFERMFAQERNKLDLFAALNEGKIILVNTAKDLLKTEGSQLFGRFFIAMLSQATLERSTVPEQRRTPTFVYVDEAQEYFDDRIETILTQARKYRVGITLSHQTLDQLSPRLRAAFLSNTSLKCAGGVSSRDARALASELHTTPEFIEDMRRRGDRTEFAMWVKHQAPEALRVTVPLGFLERQSTLTEEAFDELMAANRSRYCGTAHDVLQLASPPPLTSSKPTAAAPEPSPPASVIQPASAPSDVRSTAANEVIRPLDSPRPAPREGREQGKGGPKHRYLQSLVKELAEQQGFRATIEAPLPGNAGQIDVLLERDGGSVAVEVSVTTPADYERQNVHKCINAGFDRIALVLAKSRSTQTRYRERIMEGLSQEEREQVAFLSPEDLPDYIAGLLPPPAPEEEIIKGYKVKVSRTTVSANDARDRRERLAKLVARSLQQQAE